MQWIMVWTNHSQIIKLISTEKPGCPATSSFKSRKPPQMGFHIIVNYLLRGTEGWDKERSACNFLDQHLRLGSWSDVMWCAAHERNCWLSYFRNQKPRFPASNLNQTLSNFPLIVSDPMHARQARATTTTVSPWAAYPWEFCANQCYSSPHLRLQFNQKPHVWCQESPASEDSLCNLRHRPNSYAVSTLPYNQAAVTDLKSWGWKSNNCALRSDVIWVSTNQANLNRRAL